MVLYVPELTKNLLSTISLGHFKKFRIIMEDDSTVVVRKDNPEEILMSGYPSRGLILLDIQSVPPQTRKIKSVSVPQDQQLTELWHRRFGHVSLDKLKKLQNGGLVKGLPQFTVTPLPTCEPCLKGKQHKLPFELSQIVYNRPLQLVYSDVCGPMEVYSLGRNKYFITFIDAFSGLTCLNFLQQKSKTFIKFQEWLAYAKRYTTSKLQVLQTDNGGEYVSSVFQDYCKQAGIERRYSIPYTPEQMVVAEKRNRDINNYARSMMAHAHLPKVYWAEAVATAVHIQNRLPKSTMAPFTKAPFTCGLVIDQMYRTSVCLGAQRTHTYLNICAPNGIISHTSYVLLAMVTL